MKSLFTYNGEPVYVYAFELCHYGENGDFETFPEKELELDLAIVVNCSTELSDGIKYVSEEFIEFDYNGAGCTLFNDGRLIIEGLSPGTNLQAIELAVRIIGYGE